MYKLKKIFKNEKGQGMVEYGLVLALVSIVAVLGLGTLGGNINDRLEGIADSMSDISEPEKGSGYSDEEIDDLINQGFIPIATAEDLNSVRDGLGNKYVQVADIDLSEYSGEGWAPIGTGSSSFRGTYDGGNYAIKGLEVKGEDKDHQGLFGYTSGATIENVALEGINVNGRSYVGGLVGFTYYSTISNSYATGSVTGGSHVGGLVGWAQSSTEISNSYATGEVTGSGDYVGGLVGYAYESTKISNSYATGEVTGEDYVGGLVAFAFSAEISNSYATGSVTGEDYVGGLVGFTYYSTIKNSYWDTQTTGQSGSAGGATGKLTNEMMLKETYEGWDFDTAWKIDEGNDYPKLR